MKKHTLSISALALVLVFASCRKSDLPHNPLAQDKAKVAAATAAAPVSDWKSVGNWTSTRQEKSTSFSAQIKDNALTTANVSTGLVLVYKKEGDAVRSLPYRDKVTGQYWYYQASENDITINVDAAGTGKINNLATFRYFILSEEKIKELEAQGTTKFEIMKMSFDKASSLLQ
jgi:hypothetical protein